MIDPLEGRKFTTSRLVVRRIQAGIILTYAGSVKRNTEPTPTWLSTQMWPPRRVVAKAEVHFGELFPRVGFIVTNLETDSRAVRFYNKRGTAEQWIKEGKQVAGGSSEKNAPCVI